MFNSCHVTRLRRTSDLLLRRLLLVRLHRGRCHELYKHVPPSRGKAAAGTVALEFGDFNVFTDGKSRTFQIPPFKAAALILSHAFPSTTFTFSMSLDIYSGSPQKLHHLPLSSRIA